MNQILKTFLTKNNTINRAQKGLMPRSRTTDHIFTLKTPCNKYIKCKKVVKYLPALLISYDSIRHKELFHKLSTNQVNGQFFNIIQSMYKNSSSAVKLGNRRAQFVLCSKGL